MWATVGSMKLSHTLLLGPASFPRGDTDGETLAPPSGAGRAPKLRGRDEDGGGALFYFSTTTHHHPLPLPDFRQRGMARDPVPT